MLLTDLMFCRPDKTEEKCEDAKKSQVDGVLRPMLRLAASPAALNYFAYNFIKIIVHFARPRLWPLA